MRSAILDLAIGMAAVLGVLGCGRDGAEREGGAAAAAQSPLPATFALAREPAEAKPVKQVVAEANSGEEVVVVGRVGEAGSSTADFTLVDASQKSCTDLGDECETPWDFCCTPPDEKRIVMATVQLRDANGAVLDGSVLGFSGIDHLSTVVVQGKAEKDPTGNLTIVASGIYVRPDF